MTAVILGNGGWSPEEYANKDVIYCICFGMKSDIEKAAQTVFPVYIPVSFRTQTVEGTNYLVKVAVGVDLCIHAIIFQALNRVEVTVTGVQYPKTMADPLVPFKTLLTAENSLSDIITDTQ